METATKRPKSLRQMADERDISVASLIDSTVREHGTVKAAAKALGVNPINLYQWLSRNNYRVERSARIVKAGR